MDTIKNITGQVAEGKNFFGRKKEIARAIDLLNDGNSLILAAPRRVGKTSFARKIKDMMIEKGWNGFYIDLQKPTTEAEFIKQFLKEIKGESWFDNDFLKSIKISIKDFSVEFNQQKSDIYSKIEKTLPHDKDTLIVVDELVVFLDTLRDKEDGVAYIKHFLEWLRSLRLTSGSKIRWIFCSSISIDNFTHSHNLSHTINDLNPFPLDELKNDEPQELIKELAASKQIPFDDNFIQYMLDKLNWKLPYFIQILFKEIVELHTDGKLLSESVIDEAYQNLLNIDNYFNTWTERLSYYADERRYARILLNELSRSDTGKSRKSLYDLLFNELNDAEKIDTIFQPLLKLLETDGYIMSRDDNYDFRSTILKDFWCKNYGK